MHTGTSPCPNCGEARAGNYCSHCGQAADAHEPAIGHFFHEVTHEFLHVDGKIFRTIKALLFEPGRLTGEYWAGQIVSRVRPVRLFLVAAAGIGPVNFQVLAEREPNGKKHVAVSDDVTRRAGQNGRKPLSPEEQHEVLEQFSHTYNEVRYTSPVLFAAACWLIYRRRQRYFVNHLVGALHFYSFWYLLAIVTGELARIQPASRILNVLTALYLGLALRRLFHQSWIVTVMKAILLSGILVFVELSIALAAAILTTKKLGF